MFPLKKFLTLTFITTCLTLSVAAKKPAQLLRLTTSGYKSASVLPVYTDHGSKYAILGREVYGTKDKYTYDDFGGSRDRGEKHPLITAAREFNEEGLLATTINLTLKNTENFIDINKNNHTEHIIAFKERSALKNNSTRTADNVTYITNFNDYKDEFFKNFYPALVRAQKSSKTNKKLRVYTEKDRIAIVNWGALKDSIMKQAQTGKRAIVRARVINPITRRQERQLITLRPYLVRKLRPFFLDAPYKHGLTKKIRFYTES